MIRVKLSVFNEEAHHPVYKPQRGFKTWKEKKRDPYYHQITLVEKKSLISKLIFAYKN